jgi:hypothetical protein
MNVTTTNLSANRTLLGLKSTNSIQTKGVSNSNTTDSFLQFLKHEKITTNGLDSDLVKKILSKPMSPPEAILKLMGITASALLSLVKLYESTKVQVPTLMPTCNVQPPIASPTPPLTAGTPTPTPPAPTSEELFMKTLEGKLKGLEKVDEERLAAEIIGSSLQVKNPAVATQYYIQLNKSLPSNRNSYEGAFQDSLKELVSKKILTQDEAKTSLALGYKLAQLDENKNLLYDGIRGDKNNPQDQTIAVATTGSALKKVQAILTVGTTPTSTAPSTIPTKPTSPVVETPSTIPTTPVTPSQPTAPVSGSVLESSAIEKLLWKPESDSDKKLVVLLPASWSGKVQKVDLIESESGKVIETGKYSGIGNGEREHYRFQKSGSQYNKKVALLITYKDGDTKKMSIASPDKRSERKVS